MNKVVYTGKTIGAIRGMEGEVVSYSTCCDVSLVTIFYPEIDKKFTVKTDNVIDSALYVEDENDEVVLD